MNKNGAIVISLKYPPTIDIPHWCVEQFGQRRNGWDNGR